MKTKFLTKFLLVILIVFFALVPRITEILSGNYLFGFDQGRDYLEVKNIVINHHLTLIGSEWGGGFAGFSSLFHGPFYYYFLSIPFFIFSGNPYGGIWLMFFLSLAAIGMGYFLGKKIFGELGGLTLALLLTISPPLISAARFIWNSHPAPLFVLIAFYFIYKMTVTKREKKGAIFLAAFSSGFIYNFQTAIAIPICISLFLYSIFILRIRKLKEYVFLFLGYLLAFSPIILFNLRHNFISFNGLLQYSQRFNSDVTLMFILFLLRDHFYSFVFNFFNSFPKQNLIPSSIVFLIIFISVIYFLNKGKSKPLRQFITFVLILPLVTFLMLAFLKNAVWSYYLLHLNIVYVFLFAYIIYSSFSKNIFWSKVLSITLLLIFLFSHFPWAVNNFRVDYFDYGGTAKVKGKIEALDYLYQAAKEKSFNLLIFTPPTYTYPYDYLLWWYGEKRYGFIPSQEKRGELYLLIEKDINKPWSYKGWLETVIKIGEVKEEIELPNGFIIQKRVE